MGQVVPFDSTRRLLLVSRSMKGFFFIIKGAVAEVLDRCTRGYNEATTTPPPPSHLRAW